MAKFVTGLGTEHPQAKKGKRGNFTPTLTWKDGETRYVQFVTPASEVLSALMHQFIKVGVTAEGKDKMMEFVSRRDVAFDGEEGYDPIWERFGLEPKARKLAVAVELEPITERVNNRNKIVGYKPITRTFQRKDGTEVTVVDQKLVNQSSFVFFDTLDDLNEDRPMNEYVWKVKRTGAKTDTRYTFIDAGKAINLDIPDEQIIDLPAYLEELASPERYKVIERLPASARISRYGQPASGLGDAQESQPGSPTEEDSEPVLSDRESRFSKFKDEAGL